MFPMDNTGKETGYTSSPQEIENFRQSKAEKWKAKLDKIDCEKKQFCSQWRST